MQMCVKLFLFSVCSLSILPNPACRAEHETHSATCGQERLREEEIALGSATARAGFRNEDEIRDAFNDWKNHSEAQEWLRAMGYGRDDILGVQATKPHGQKADVEVRITTKTGTSFERISVKLVSNRNGFNQIDKRWLKTYAEMWNMPRNVHEALELFVGEKPPLKSGRDERRMFLNELPDEDQKAVIEFFRQNRETIVSDLLAGNGEQAADWIMVTLKGKAVEAGVSEGAGEDPESNLSVQRRWTIRSTQEATAFYGDGEVSLTRYGSLRIGRITMQRKGGDNGRPTARMLQFKMNPVELFELEQDISVRRRF